MEYLLSAILSPLHSCRNEELHKKHLCIKIPTIKNTELTLFTVSKDDCNTKEDTGKCIVCTVACRNAYVGLIGQQKKIKPVTLAIIELYLPEGISQSVENCVK